MLNPSICFSTANGGLLLLIANSGFLINSLHGTLPTYVFSSYHILHMYTWWGFDHHLFLSSEGFGIVRTSELCLNLPFIMKTPSFFCKESLLQKPPLLFQTTPSFSAKKPPFIFATMKELLNSANFSTTAENSYWPSSYIFHSWNFTASAPER